MRPAHGDAYDHVQMDDEAPASDWQVKIGGNCVPPINKIMHAFRTNPNRLKSRRVCKSCDKQFLSWKSFLRHGKCGSHDADQWLVSFPGSDGEDGTPTSCCCSFKRKRSLRAEMSNHLSTEEEALANCLLMLATATAEPEALCASASIEAEQRNPLNFKAPVIYGAAINDNAKPMFECKECKKVFKSHQALGGHRASHKKVKGCFAARLDDSLTDEDVISHKQLFLTKSASAFQFDHGYSNPSPLLSSTAKRKSKVHECSICHRVFSSGQALGGHKRCHWITSNSSYASPFSKFQHRIEQIQQRQKCINNNSDTLDLNHPAPADHNALPPDPLTDNRNLEVSTEINLKTWVGVEAKEQQQNDHDNKDNNNSNNNNRSMQNVRDEASSKAQSTKLGELKDMNMNGSSSPWLHVGISSATDVGRLVKKPFGRNRF